jgi:hypothetical protein
MGAALPRDILLDDESQKRLVRERRGLQRVTRSCFSVLSCGQPPHFLVDDGEELLDGGGVSPRQRGERFGDVVRVRQTRVRLIRISERTSSDLDHCDRDWLVLVATNFGVSQKRTQENRGRGRSGKAKRPRVHNGMYDRRHID